VDQVNLATPAPSAFSFKWHPAQLNPTASAHLDLVRAVAAWAVMWGHLRGLFFVDYHDLPAPGRLLGLVYFLTGFGHQAVMVFFILSGFLISTSVFKMLATESWSWTEYIISRAARLYVVLIPGLLLGLLWDAVGSHAFALSGLYSQPLRGFGSSIARDNLTVGNFFGNLFFLQTIRCRTFGSNGPLWSLANEFWYYVLFPLVLFAALAWMKRSIRTAALLSLFALAVSWFVGNAILLGFFIWLTGTLLVVAHKELKLPTAAWRALAIAASSVFLAICLYTARMGQWGETRSDLAVGAGFALFLYGLLQLDWTSRAGAYPRITHTFAAFSYSLYVLHFPLLLFLRAWITPDRRWQPDLPHLVWGLLLGGLVILFAWAVSLCTENRTSVVRNWLRARVGRRQF